MAFICRDFQSADKIFNARGPVRSAQWAPNERPLDDRPQKQHRLIKHVEDDVTYYDIKLYNTIMARFYEPKVEWMMDAVRLERRLYMGDSSQTSRQFMFHTLRVSEFNIMYTGVASNDIVWPVYNHAGLSDRGTPFSLDATFVNGELVPLRSAHTPHYRMVADTDDKKRRVEVAKHFENYITLALMRMPAYKAACVPQDRLGRPFGGNGFEHKEYEAVQCLLLDEEPSQYAFEAFFAMCQGVYDTIVSKRGRGQQGFVLNRSWGSSRTVSSPDELKKPVETPEFRRSILERVYKYAGENKRSKKVEVKQFPKYSEYPKSNICC